MEKDLYINYIYVHCQLIDLSCFYLYGYYTLQFKFYYAILPISLNILQITFIVLKVNVLHVRNISKIVTKIKQNLPTFGVNNIRHESCIIHKCRYIKFLITIINSNDF